MIKVVDKPKDPTIEETDVDHEKCSICATYKRNYVTNCGHLFCGECIKLPTCSICSELVYKRQLIYL